MRIAIDTIPKNGRDIHVDLDDAWAVQCVTVVQGCPGEPGSDAPVATEALDFSLNIHRVADCVMVTGEGGMVLSATCDRCGTSVRLRLSGPIDLSYMPPAGALGDAESLEQEQLDVGWHDGQNIDLSHVLSEQLALWAPDRVLCSDELVERPSDAPVCALPVEHTEVGINGTSPFAGLRLPE